MANISKESGFSLLELMIASTFMLLGLVALLGGIVRINTANQFAADRATVMSRVATVMDELNRATTNELLAYAPPPFAGMVPATNVQVMYVDAGGNEATPASFTPATLPNPLEIRVTVNTVSRLGHPINVQSSTVIESD